LKNKKAKFGPSEKKGHKTFGVIRDEIFPKNSRLHPFGPQREWKNVGRFESRSS
jgi:hypothetical protein